MCFVEVACDDTVNFEDHGSSAAVLLRRMIWEADCVQWKWEDWKGSGRGL